MSRRISRSAVILASVALLAGCASSNWRRHDEPTELAAQNGLRVISPAGWVQHLENDGAVHLTRDGFALQRISAYALQPRSAGGGPLTADDVARALEGEIRKRTDRQVDLLETRWTRGESRQGVRLLLRSEWRRSAARRHLVYGWLQGATLIVLEYDAADLYYFDRNLADFEAVVASAEF